jgi:hypothetical protein
VRREFVEAGVSNLGAAVLSAHVDTVENFRCETHASRDARRKRQLTITSAGSVLQSRSPLVFVERSMCGTPIPLLHHSDSRGNRQRALFDW